ncbi:hypothetical protein CDD83_5904 [Cordyceps sp. RAO-2017]|nr:hypothetical protein CDD83_5904 [Cordyceps sp. RAO-2017]
MTTTAGIPSLGIGAQAGAPLMHMSLDNDLALDPRMDLPLFGIKYEKETADSPGQFVLTPRMFEPDPDTAAMDCIGGTEAAAGGAGGGAAGGLAADADGCRLPMTANDDESIVALITPDASRTPPSAPASVASPPEACTLTRPAAAGDSIPRGAEERSKSRKKKRPPLGAAAAEAAEPKTRTKTRAQPKRNATAPSSAPSTITTTAAAAAATISCSPPGKATSATKRAGTGGGSGGAAGPGEEARRSRCLERNRIAASKCREKKKAWVHELEASRAELESRHAGLQREYSGLLEEATQIKTSLMAHAACNDPKIDTWIETEATRFVQRSNRLHQQQSQQQLQNADNRHSSIASLASLHGRHGEFMLA